MTLPQAIKVPPFTGFAPSILNVLKRSCRRTHGRGKLTHDFQALPEEYVLLANLEHPGYVDLVLDGSLDNLAGRFAEASGTAGSFSEWRHVHHPRLIGHLPP